MTSDIILRDVTADDLPIFFEQQLDDDANYMAAFTIRNPADRAAFMAHWARIRDDDTIIKKTIVAEGQVAGNIAVFEEFGEPEVGYWLGKRFWSQGIATQALTALLANVKRRPLYGRVAKDNIASRRVLEKCGFVVTGADTGYANARGAEITELILELA